MDRYDTHAQMMPSDRVCDSMGCEELELVLVLVLALVLVLVLADW